MTIVASQTQVLSLVEWVKEHEDYNSELQEAEKWLLQMSSRLVTSDSMQTSSMEMATQQLARHKVRLAHTQTELIHSTEITDQEVLRRLCGHTSGQQYPCDCI